MDVGDRANGSLHLRSDGAIEVKYDGLRTALTPERFLHFEITATNTGSDRVGFVLPLAGRLTRAWLIPDDEPTVEAINLVIGAGGSEGINTTWNATQIAAWDMNLGEVATALAGVGPNFSATARGLAYVNATNLTAGVTVWWLTIGWIPQP
jgi:hypothetical protein